MKKVLALIITTIALFGCVDNDPQGRIGEMEYVPTGAKLIKDYEDLWMMRELDGNCFLSYNLKGRSGLLTQVKCNQNRDLTNGDADATHGIPER